MPASRLRDRARKLRANDTRAETKLWSALRNRQLGGWKWKRQVPRGRYIVDFHCAEAKVVVEVDGGQHADRIKYDDRRTLDLEESGLTVLRFWNSEVLSSLEGVCIVILAACEGAAQQDPSPILSPRSGERG